MVQRVPLVSLTSLFIVVIADHFGPAGLHHHGVRCLSPGFVRSPTASGSLLLPLHRSVPGRHLYSALALITTMSSARGAPPPRWVLIADPRGHAICLLGGRRFNSPAGAAHGPRCLPAGGFMDHGRVV